MNIWFDLETYRGGFPLYGTFPVRECPICELGDIPWEQYILPAIVFVIVDF